jgi:hypothetical protein
MFIGRRGVYLRSPQRNEGIAPIECFPELAGDAANKQLHMACRQDALPKNEPDDYSLNPILVYPLQKDIGIPIRHSIRQSNVPVDQRQGGLVRQCCPWIPFGEHHLCAIFFQHERLVFNAVTAHTNIHVTPPLLQPLRTS